MGLRLANIAAAAAASAAALVAPANAATVEAKVKATVVKPLVIRSIQDLDFGTVVLGPGTWSGATINLSRTGVLSCPASVTCSGATQAATYNIAGSNHQTVVISAPDIVLVNQRDPRSTLTLVVDSPATVTLTNSGVQGQDFSIGGSISVDSTTSDGDYAGTFDVTADYQ